MSRGTGTVGAALTRVDGPCLTGGVGDRPGLLEPVLRQLRAVRRRSNLRLVQHAGAVWVAVLATVTGVVVLAALRAGRLGFLGVALLALAAALGVTVAVGRRVVRGWLPAGEAAAHVDASRALHGRVSSVTELRHRAHGDLFALLVRQNLDALARWRPEDVVPEIVPGRAFAAAVAAVSFLALVVVLAPALRRPPPRVVVGDRRIDFVPAHDEHAGADRLLVAPGTEHPAPGADGSSTAREPGVPDAVADASTALQDWLQHALGVEERWEAGDQIPDTREPDSRHAASKRRSDTRPVDGDGEAPGTGEPRDADGRTARSAGSDRPGAEERGGGGGAGAGSDTDPTLYGEARDEPAPGADRFELAIAARVRTRRGAAMDRWTAAPGPDADRQPALAGRQQAEQPGHRMPIPPPFAPLVRRLYAHQAPGAAP